MAQEDKRGEGSADEDIWIKKRARRRLIGAAALALLAAIVLPMVMDHQPAPSLKDIQVRIPSPDEGVARRVAPRPEPEGMAKAAEEPKAVVKPAPEAEKAGTDEPEPKRARDALAGKIPGEAWEVQLGAYRNAASVSNLVGKLKDLGIPTYTESVDTPSGSRIRVRAGPFSTQEAAEKVRQRVRIIGVDGPVAKKP